MLDTLRCLAGPRDADFDLGDLPRKLGDPGVVATSVPRHLLCATLRILRRLQPPWFRRTGVVRHGGQQPRRDGGEPRPRIPPGLLPGGSQLLPRRPKYAHAGEDGRAAMPPAHPELAYSRHSAEADARGQTSRQQRSGRAARRKLEAHQLPPRGPCAVLASSRNVGQADEGVDAVRHANRLHLPLAPEGRL